MSANPQIAASPFLFVAQIQDVYLRKNFQNLIDYFTAQNQLLGFKFAELNFLGAQTNFQFPHGLDFIPQDIVVSRITGPGKVTFKYDSFDKTNIILSVDAACRIRFFYGTYWNFTSNLDNKPTDSMVISSS